MFSKMDDIQRRLNPHGREVTRAGFYAGEGHIAKSCHGNEEVCKSIEQLKSRYHQALVNADEQIFVLARR